MNNTIHPNNLNNDKSQIFSPSRASSSILNIATPVLSNEMKQQSLCMLPQFDEPAGAVGCDQTESQLGEKSNFQFVSLQHLIETSQQQQQLASSTDCQQIQTSHQFIKFSSYTISTASTVSVSLLEVSPQKRINFECQSSPLIESIYEPGTAKIEKSESISDKEIESDELQMNSCAEMDQENDITAEHRKSEFITKITQSTSELWEGDNAAKHDEYLLELYSKIDKNNVNKNIMQSFMRHVLLHGDNVVLECIDTKQKELGTIRKELKNFIRNKKFNNKMINSFFNSERYKQQFQYFLQVYAIEYFQASKVQDKPSHFVCIAFFIRCFYNNSLRDHIVTYNKSKYFRSTNKQRKQYPIKPQQQLSSSPKQKKQDA